MTTAGSGRQAGSDGPPRRAAETSRPASDFVTTTTTGKGPLDQSGGDQYRTTAIHQFSPQQQATNQHNNISQQQHQQQQITTTTNDYATSNYPNQPTKEESHNRNRSHQSESHFRLEEVTNQCSSDDEQVEDEESLSEALLAVASAEEYAAKITKLQQACLTPLKEDLADWLNKILKSSSITTENFMDKLDNGVIICRLAKIISLWCEQQLTKDTAAITTTNNVGGFRANNGASVDTENYDLPIPRPRLTQFVNGNGALKYSSSQSTNCLVNSHSTTSLSQSGYTFHSNHFLNNLTRMHQSKIWEDAKGRTFYARDNVCSFIDWSKEFGVNQSVLFESDDLVLHANARQVVLCLLDVARIAYVKYGFTEAPGLVKFEQEIDREMAAAAAAAITTGQNNSNSTDAIQMYKSQTSDNQPKGYQEKITSSRAKNLRSLSVADATDELILRYCKHKEQEAARKRSEELAMATDKMLNEELAKQPEIGIADHQVIEADSLMPDELVTSRDEMVTVSSSNSNNLTSTTTTHNACPVDSLDSGEGPTDSASTGLSRIQAGSQPLQVTCDDDNEIQEPTPSKRTSLSPTIVSQPTSSTPDSEISSSHSSLSSNQDETNQSSGFGREITSDLDGKVMRIAKSYYGKGATKDVTRLSEGKYKIADRIVFVRLLKGHRVMVRIGGGWDTLENFLFRHKSDPSQVIDVDNLLPLETKMSFEKSPQINSTPTNKSSKLPHYRRSNSASSTNLSISNLSISNHSISSSNTPSNRGGYGLVRDRQVSNSVESSPARHNQQRVPYLLIHNGLKNHSRIATPAQNNLALYNKNGHRITPQARSGSTSLLKRPQPHYQHQQQEQQRAKPFANKYDQHHPQRPLSASRAPAASASNLYPATLTTRITPGSLKPSADKPANSTNHLNGSKTSKISYKSENLRNSGRSNESLQASGYNKSPLNRKPKFNGSSHQLNGSISIFPNNYELNNDK